MTDKIQEITKKIYDEGITRAQEEAEKLLEEARKEAKNIIANAKKEEEIILKKAKTASEDIHKNTTSELQLAAQQFISNLKQQVTDLVITTPVETEVNKAFGDQDLVKKLIVEMVKKWDILHPEERDVRILISENDKQNLDEFFKSKAIEKLNSGVTVAMDSDSKGGFRIGPADGSYVISFSAKEFENYFKSYLKSKTKNLLFEDG